jgi:hypothetical protein
MTACSIPWLAAGIVQLGDSLTKGFQDAFGLPHVELAEFPVR